MSLRMGEPSYERFKSWVDNIYWSHFQVLHFAQFLRSGYDQHFALPKTFSDNLKKKLTDNMGLRGPSGIVWKIELTARDDTLYFTHGWQQFVEDHCLKENDFLVFKYNGGESLFDVLIFDGENFCEKATSYFVRKCEQTEHEGGCSSKRKDTDCVVEVNAPSNAGLKHAAPEKTVNDNSDRVPAAVPFASASNERTFNAGVESASLVQFMLADGDTVPGGFLLLEHGGGCSSKRKGTDNSVEEGSSPSDAGVECAAPEISVHDNGVSTPAAVPSNERTFNAGVESVSPEQFMDANGDMVPTAVPSQTTTKRVREAVSAVKHVSTKRRGRPPKASSTCQTVVDNDDCGNGVKTPSNADVECVAPEKSVNHTNVVVPAAVPFEAPNSERSFNAGVESSPLEQFMDANGDVVPIAVPSHTTNKRARKAVSAVKHVHTKRRGRPLKGSSARQGVVDNDDCVEEVNTHSNADVECAAPGKSVNNNSVIVPAAVPFEASSERTFNAIVESSSPEQFKDVNGDAVPTAVPSQTTNITVRKAVSAVKHVHTKRRGRSPKASSARQSMVDNDDFKTPSNADVECAAPAKSVNNNSVIVPAAVPFKASSSDRIINANVDSSSLEQFKDVNGDKVPIAVPSQTTGKRVRKAVSAVQHVPTKQRGRTSKASSARQAMVDNDDCGKDVKTPSNADVECTAPKKSVNNNSVIVPAAVPFKAPGSDWTFDADVDSSSLEQFKDVNGDAVPTAVPSQTTDKRARKLVSAFSHVQTKRRGRPRKGSCPIQGVVDSVNCMDKANTPSKAAVECAAPAESVQDNSVVPATVRFKTPASERTFDAGVESASPEKFMQANGGTVPIVVPLQTSDNKFMIRKLVSPVKHIQTKPSESPPKASSARQGVVDWVTDSEAASVRQSEPHVELFTSNRRPVTEDEINNAQRLAQATCSNKSLLIVMRPEHVYDRFCLSMPSKWIVEHLPQRSQDLILCMGESEWHVKYCYHRTSYSGELTVGWRNFALDNNLEEFDVCVFEATGKSKINGTLIMEVKIFRVVEDISPLSIIHTPGKRGRKRAISAI
ncbi:hypothetical protein RIF29_06060 [Crotalaria pallida]|uniref:TF-B3 domain-containing protein n=1 Tax=Crotalaria pallida TaxID=3830 RepID=A0AAN9J3U9_CROPI